MGRQTIRRWLVTIIVLIVAAFLFLYPLDYYIKKPGDAYNAANYITVDQRDEDDQGEFRFTTVAMMEATPFLYLLALLLPNQDIVATNSVRQEEEDEDEYEVRQLKLMDSSQFNAIYIAFDRAKIPVEVNYKGISVLNIIEGSAADGVLKAGDEIVEIDNTVVSNLQQLGDKINTLKKGDKLKLVIERDKELLTKELILKKIPNTEGKVGLGITYTENKTIKTDPFVKLNTNDIGGPSAGLMFTLEILNQILDEDLTHGKVIAGTGTMESDGTVGRIGGIDKKVVAADRAGAQYFLAPDDTITEEMLEYNPELISNYEEALKKAKEIGTKMKIVPIHTVDDAIKFLNNLK